jgi:excisionase family DNA binding protein
MIVVAARKKPLDPNAEIMTVGEVADYLRVSVSTIYREAKRGNLPGFRLGSDWRFVRASLDVWMREKVAVSKTAIYPPRVKK